MTRENTSARCSSIRMYNEEFYMETFDLELDEVEVTYQFGIVQDTGDGILRRVNRIVTTEDELI
jgi:hypothetical protein